MNKNIIVAFSIAILLFAMFAIYGLVNQSYLDTIPKKEKKTTEVTTVKTSQECTKKDGDRTYKYTFYLNGDKIDKINISYENSNNPDEFNLLKGYLTTAFGGITNKHLMENDNSYVFTFDINDFSETLNELDIIKQLNLNVYNTDSISEYIIKLDENNFSC